MDYNYTMYDLCDAHPSSWLKMCCPALIPAGCNIGEDVWELFCKEHNIDQHGRRTRPNFGKIFIEVGR